MANSPSEPVNIFDIYDPIHHELQACDCLSWGLSQSLCGGMRSCKPLKSGFSITLQASDSKLYLTFLEHTGLPFVGPGLPLKYDALYSMYQGGSGH